METMFQRPQLSREEWVAKLNEIREDITESYGSDRATWDRLTYFTKTLKMGVELRNLMEAGFKWFSNTKVADALDIDAARAMYLGSYNILLGLIETFEDVVNAQIKAEGSTVEQPDLMRYVS